MFKKLNETKMKESELGRVELPCSAMVGRNFIKFIYTRELVVNTPEETEMFLQLGDVYEIETLKKIAEQELVNKLNVSNMLHYFRLGDLYGAKELFEKSKDLIKPNMKMVMCTEEWIQLVRTKKDLVIELMSSVYY